MPDSGSPRAAQQPPQDPGDGDAAHEKPGRNPRSAGGGGRRRRSGGGGGGGVGVRCPDQAAAASSSSSSEFTAAGIGEW